MCSLGIYESHYWSLQAKEKHLMWIKLLGRVGWGAKCVIYALIGGLACDNATGNRNSSASPQVGLFLLNSFQSTLLTSLGHFKLSYCRLVLVHWYFKIQVNIIQAVIFIDFELAVQSRLTRIWISDNNHQDSLPLFSLCFLLIFLFRRAYVYGYILGLTCNVPPWIIVNIVMIMTKRVLQRFLDYILSSEVFVKFRERLCLLEQLMAAAEPLSFWQSQQLRKCIDSIYFIYIPYLSIFLSCCISHLACISSFVSHSAGCDSRLYSKWNLIKVSQPQLNIEIQPPAWIWPSTSECISPTTEKYCQPTYQAGLPRVSPCWHAWCTAADFKL